MKMRVKDGIVIEWHEEMRRWLPTDVRSRSAAIKANSIQRKYRHLDLAEQHQRVARELGGQMMRSLEQKRQQR